MQQTEQLQAFGTHLQHIGGWKQRVHFEDVDARTVEWHLVSMEQISMQPHEMPATCHSLDRQLHLSSIEDHVERLNPIWGCLSAVNCEAGTSVLHSFVTSPLNPSCIHLKHVMLSASILSRLTQQHVPRSSLCVWY